MKILDRLPISEDRESLRFGGRYLTIHPNQTLVCYSVGELLERAKRLLATGKAKVQSGVDWVVSSPQRGSHNPARGIAPGTR